MKAHYLLLVVFAACAGCPPKPGPGPSDDGGTLPESGPGPVTDSAPPPVGDAATTDCMKACANLRVVKCSQAANCESVCQHSEDTHLTNLNLADCIKAPDKTHLGKCNIHCQ